MSQPPSTTTSPAKKALSISISYNHLQEEAEKAHLVLGDVHEDSNNIVNLLTKTFGYAKEDITVLNDNVDESKPNTESPTHNNILRAMQDLVSGAKEGDHLVFHISAHGSQRKCPIEGQELDGYDEMFWPVDVTFDHDKLNEESAKNIILDDTIKEILVDKLPPGVNLVMIADCCHSGTIADLPYGHVAHEPRTQSIRLNTKDEQDPNNLRHVVCWSACRDEDKAHNPVGKSGIFTRIITDTIGRPASASQTHSKVFDTVSERMGKIVNQMKEPLRPHLSTLYRQTEELTISASFGEREAAA